MCSLHVAIYNSFVLKDWQDIISMKDGFPRKQQITIYYIIIILMFDSNLKNKIGVDVSIKYQFIVADK